MFGSVRKFGKFCFRQNSRNSIFVLLHYRQVHPTPQELRNIKLQTKLIMILKKFKYSIRSIPICLFRIIQYDIIQKDILLMNLIMIIQWPQACNTLVVIIVQPFWLSWNRWDHFLLEGKFTTAVTIQPFVITVRVEQSTECVLLMKQEHRNGTLSTAVFARQGQY